MEPRQYDDEMQLVDSVLERVGKKIIIGTPLGAGKANHILNAFYRRAKEDQTIELTICTALTLQKPSGKSLLEKRFMDPFAERVFGDYVNLEYEDDRHANTVPANIEILEFYFPAGKFIGNRKAQQNYISSNYTHVCRDMIDRGINVLVQLVCEGEVNGNKRYSLSCNPDVSLDMVPLMRKREKETGQRVAVVGQVNKNLPFMYGDAVVKPELFDFILKNDNYHYKIFGPPKMPVLDQDYMIGLNASTLVKDGGELQVGIGALGDAFVYALQLRHKHNDIYNKLVTDLNLKEKHGDVIKEWGGTGIFREGLFGATEMFVDAFMHLVNDEIIKRKVYDDVYIQRLLNEGKITDKVTPEIVDELFKRKWIHGHITEAEFDRLQHFGIFKGPDELSWHEGYLHLADGTKVEADLTEEADRKIIFEKCLGTELKHGTIIHGGFFLGPNSFYQWLRDMPEERRKLFNMKSVQSINQLYGHEEIDRLHRKDARFVNTCMYCTMNGNVVSDGIASGQVVSGVGGQYNFVSMAHALPDGRSIIKLRSTSSHGGGPVTSNIVWNYGHTTIPRHLRDIVVTEYGIANLRGKTDREIAEALIKIADSRFQDSLINRAKREGKLPQSYVLPDIYRNNTPEMITSKLAFYKKKGHFARFPFGTDFTPEEQILGKTLKSLARKAKKKHLLLPMMVKAFSANPGDKKIRPYMDRMKLTNPNGLKEKLYAGMLANELRLNL